MLQGLEPGQVYEIRTVSVDGEYFNHSDTEEVSTADWRSLKTMLGVNTATPPADIGMSVHGL